MNKSEAHPIVYPGSFDPFTLGHLDILRRALMLFGRVTVLVAGDGKAGLLGIDKRVALIEQATDGLPGVDVRPFHGLLVDAVADMGAVAVIRGIRCAGDYEHEWSMAGVNALLGREVEFVYLLAKPELAAVSSTLVRDVIKYGGPLDKLVPAEIAAALKKDFSDG